MAQPRPSPVVVRRSAPLAGVLALGLLLPAAATAGESRCSGDGDAYEQVACQLADAGAAPLCDEIPTKVQRRVGRRLAACERLVRRAGTVSRAKQTLKLVRKAERRLVAAARQVDRADRKGKLPAGCAETAGGRLDGLRALVAGLAVDVPEAPAGLPDYVAGYQGWQKLNAAPLPVRTSDPHSGVKDVFVNQSRETIAPGGVQQFPYPDGSIVVKESTRPGQDFAHLVAIMRKRAGSDPAHGNWDFVEYTRGSADGRFAVAARDGVCWGCHGDVRDVSDWVFTPLE